MHPIFHVEAIVLTTYATNEANKTVVLFTKELGIVKVRAQGVRKSTAKLRSHIIDYSFIKADLVKGRGMWRMTSAKLEYNPLLGMTHSPHARAYVRMLALIERFLGEENANPELFTHLYEVVQLLHATETVEKIFDTVTLWKCMALLGYVSVPETLEKYFSEPLSVLLKQATKETADELIKQVNNAIQQTHL